MRRSAPLIKSTLFDWSHFFGYLLIVAVIPTTKIFLLKIFVNIILIRMSFPVIHGISLNASGTSIKVKQPKQKGSKAQPVEKVTYQSSMPEFRWHDLSEFREIINYISLHQ